MRANQIQIPPLLTCVRDMSTIFCVNVCVDLEIRGVFLLFQKLKCSANFLTDLNLLHKITETPFAESPLNSGTAEAAIHAC